MKYMYIITLQNLVKGNHTIIDVITATPQDTRATLFAQIYDKCCQEMDIHLSDYTAVVFFYLEPLELTHEPTGK